MSDLRIESKTVILRRITNDDADGIFFYRSLKEIAKYQYWEPFTRKQTLYFIDKYKNSRLNNQGKWIGLIIESTGDHKIVGDCAAKIQDYKLSIGCNVSPQYQMHGFAKEALILLINYCLRDYDISEIYGITDSRNIASIKLMQSLGMQKTLYEKKVECKGDLCIEIKYSIDKISWKNIN
jgi:RimJ/RimL family protein N-acetyltransferase